MKSYSKMEQDFKSIDYLKSGNDRQQWAYSLLTNQQILLKLRQYDPILVGTIPLAIDIETSDLDIICCYADQQEFRKVIKDNFKDEKDFTIREQLLGTSAIVANFSINNVEIEIFGQPIPTNQQVAYKHLLVEHDLLNKYGEEFRQQILELKQQGLKTEPAFALALGLTGDPYTELLKL